MSDETAPPPMPMPRPRTHWIVWAFALVGLLGVLALIFLALQVTQIGRQYQPAKVAGATPEIVFTLGDVQELRGTNFIQLDVAVSRGGGSSSAYSSGGGEEDTRNILLLDKSSGASRKLLPDNNRRIVQTRYLSAEGDLYSTGIEELATVDEDRLQAPYAYYLLSVKQANGSDLQDIFVGTLSTGNQAYVMRGIDGIDSIWMHSPTQIGMIVRERLNLFHRIIDIPSLKVTHSKRIDIG